MRKHTLPSGEQLVQARGGISRDLRILRALSRNYVVSGLTVTPMSPASSGVVVEAGVAYVAGNRVEISSDTELVGTAAHSTLGRIDVVELDSDGNLYYVPGTAASVPATPVVSSENRIILAAITRAANDNSIGSSDINNEYRPTFDTSSLTYRLGRRMS